MRARLALLAVALLLGGCRGCASTRPPIHLNPNMDNQPKLLPQAESRFFADGAAMRRPVEGTVAQGELREDTALWGGRDAGGGFVSGLPVAVDERVLRRGEERYGVFCGPCHGPQADGKGMLFQRAKVASADLLSARVRAMPAGQLYDVVTHGVGLMPPYGSQVPVEDRWAIIAFLRKLQADTPPAAEGAADEPGAPATAADAAAEPAASPGASPTAAPAAAAPAATAAAPAVPPAATAAPAATPDGGEGRR